MYLYACILGREWKLSLAELIALFGTRALEHFSQTVAIFRISTPLHSDTLLTLGGTTRIIEILCETTPEQFPTDVLARIQSEHPEKLHFALGSFGVTLPLADIGMRMKKSLISSGIKHIRYLNTHHTPVHSAVFKKERLAKTKMEWSIIALPEGEAHDESPIEIPVRYFLGRTIACQDIDAYRRRDTGKNRDMTVGMMPPKLVQILLNIAQISENTLKEVHVYDPFCGLGTTLIEAAQRGVTMLSGSDISLAMVDATTRGLSDFIRTEILWQERIRNAGGTPKKDSTQIVSNIFPLDAKEIHDAFSQHHIPKNATLISEGYLGQIMKPNTITQDVVFSEKKIITALYDAFFAGLKKGGFSGIIVMSFPFWKVGDVTMYLDTLPDILAKYGFRIESLLPRSLGLNTKNGSLLYRRPSQTVGREIVKITKW